MELDSSSIPLLDQLSQLRLVELSDVISLDTSIASQIAEVEVTRGISHRRLTLDCSSLRRHFPSAELVSFDTFAADVLDPVVLDLSSLPSTIRSLTLHRSQPFRHQPSLDSLSQLPQLSHLHLDFHFFLSSAILVDCICTLQSLRSLSLAINTLDRHFLRIFEPSSRPQSLESIKIVYVPLNPSPRIDLTTIISALSSDMVDPDDKVFRLVEKESKFPNMDGWSLCCTKDPVGGVLLAEKMELLAVMSGITLRTNLEDLRNLFHRQLVEFFSRGIAAIRLYHDSSAVKIAQGVAESLLMKLPPVLIDLDGDLDEGNLSWFRFDMRSMTGELEGDEWRALNIKYDGSTCVGEVAENEDEDEETAEGSDELEDVDGIPSLEDSISFV
jgi:hypothetical protein